MGHIVKVLLVPVPEAFDWMVWGGNLDSHPRGYVNNHLQPCLVRSSHPQWQRYSQF
jgi:hypothetical protein